MEVKVIVTPCTTYSGGVTVYRGLVARREAQEYLFWLHEYHGYTYSRDQDGNYYAAKEEK
jgi:hypothetical protein